DLAIDRLAQPGQLPLGQIPAHRHGDGTDLPRREGGEEELRGVAQADAEPVSEAETTSGQRVRQLARPKMELGPGERRLVVVLGDERERPFVWTLTSEIADAAGEADSTTRLRGPRPDRTRKLTPAPKHLRPNADLC